MPSQRPSHVHDLIDRAARCVDALLDLTDGKPVSRELLPAARDLVRELRVYLVEKGAR